MTTLIAVYNSEGCVGRCDASCYNAKHDKCVCCCGGMNHGKGLQQAVENTQAMAEATIMEWCHEHADGEDLHWEIPAREPMQLAFA